MISEVQLKTPRPDVTCGTTPVCSPCCDLGKDGEWLLLDLKWICCKMWLYICCWESLSYKDVCWGPGSPKRMWIPRLFFMARMRVFLVWELGWAGVKRLKNPEVITDQTEQRPYQCECPSAGGIAWWKSESVNSQVGVRVRGSRAGYGVSRRVMQGWARWLGRYTSARGRSLHQEEELALCRTVRIKHRLLLWGNFSAPPEVQVSAVQGETPPKGSEAKISCLRHESATLEARF